MKWPTVMCTVTAVAMTCDAFNAAQISIHRHTKLLTRFSRQFALPSVKESNIQDGIQTKTGLDHPHSLMWSTTLQQSPNSYVHPSVKLAIRPPSDGGTGIVAIDDIPADTVVMSLRLEEVGMIDATSILNSYKQHPTQDDAVFNMLVEMWDKELEPVSKTKEESQEGMRLAVLAGIVAHLQLVRYKDLTSWVATDVKEGFALDESRRLGHFLDAMPLMPQKSKATKHPFPSHFLFWTDDEVEILLQGTIAQTKAREVRAGVGLILREWSKSLLNEHSPAVTQTEILNAIFSAFASVLSRSFGDAAGRDLDGKGRMLVPMVDMLNHDSETPNVSWKWHVGVGDEEMIAEGKGDIAVTTLRDVRKGEELVKCYGWRPAWDIASSYGFVPRLVEERWECSAIPLFPAMLDLTPDDISFPAGKAEGNSSLDLLLEANYGDIVKAVLAAVEASVQIRSKMNLDKDFPIEHDSDTPNQLKRIEILSLFRPVTSTTHNKQTADAFPFPRRQPVIVVGTKIHTDDSLDRHHNIAIDSVLPAFRAAASAISQLRYNYQNDISSPIEAQKMAVAAAAIDKETDWDSPALSLMLDGIDERMKALVQYEKDARQWLAKGNDLRSSDDRQSRASLSRDARNAELRALQKLRSEILQQM